MRSERQREDESNNESGGGGGFELERRENRSIKVSITLYAR